jgi:hypothetical protein
LLAVADSGDTGTEEIAKKRFNQLLPCSNSLSCPSGGMMGGRSGSLGLLASCSLSVLSGVKASGGSQGDHGWELGGPRSRKGSWVRSSRWIAVHLRLPASSEEGVGLPGAHVLAVVPAHRGYVAEVRGWCRLQISSRNALQKQRQTRVNGRLDGARCWGLLQGWVSSKKHHDSVQWRPKATTWRQGPGWRHERHSAARSLERGSGRVPRSV